MRRLVPACIAFALSAAVAAPQNPPSLFAPPAIMRVAASPFRHAYYLFLSDPPVACEQCYVPLLLTIAPLEEVAKDSAGQDCDLITTYERDSVYVMNGIVRVAASDIAAAPRTIRVRKRNYRYQEITGAEVLHLFENPMGTIPVSRTFFRSDLPPGPALDALIAGFRSAK